MPSLPEDISLPEHVARSQVTGSCNVATQDSSIVLSGFNKIIKRMDTILVPYPTIMILFFQTVIKSYYVYP